MVKRDVPPTYIHGWMAKCCDDAKGVFLELSGTF